MKDLLKLPHLKNRSDAVRVGVRLLAQEYLDDDEYEGYYGRPKGGNWK